MKLKNTALLISCMSFGAILSASSIVNATDFDEYKTPLCGPGKCGNKGTTAVSSNKNVSNGSTVGKVIPFSQVSQKPSNQRQSFGTSGRKKNVASTANVTLSKDEFSHSFYYRSFPESLDFAIEGKSYSPNIQDGLWRIATNTKGKGISVHQQVAAIYRKNLNCFINGNADDRDKKCPLKMPTFEQAKAEKDSDGVMLLTYHGTAASDYNYALNNCKYGVCTLTPKQEQPSQQATKQEAKTENKQSVETVVDNSKQEKPSKSSDIQQQDPPKKDPSINIQLVDNTGAVVPLPDVIPSAAQPTNNTDAEKKNAEIAGSSANVFAINQNALDEYNRDLHKELDRVYGKKISESQEDIKTLSANQVAMVNEYKEEIQKLNEKIDKLSEIIQEKESLVPPVITEQTVLEEDSDFKMWIIIIACIFFVLSFVGYFFVTKTKKIENEDMDENVDDLDSDDQGLGSLMTTQYQIPTGGDNTNVPDSDASSEINLNDDETAQSSKPKKDSYMIQENNDDLVPLDLGVADDSSAENSKIETPKESLDEWDEESFTQEMSTQKVDQKMSFDLESDDNEAQIDSILNKAETMTVSSNPTVDDLLKSIDTDNNSQNEDLKLDNNSGLNDEISSAQPNEKVSNDDDIDALLATAQPNEKVSNDDDLDALLASAQPNEKVSNDDLDALLASAQPNEKVSNDDDLDALLASAQPNEKVSNDDDLDALIASVQPNEKVSSDDIDDLLASTQPAQKQESADLKSSSSNDIDELLSSVQSSPKVTHDDDIDEILASAHLDKPGDAKKASAEESAKKSTEEIDDIDSILDMVKDPEGDKKHEEQMKMLEAEAQEQMNVYEPDREEVAEEIPEADQEQFTLVDVYIKNMADKDGARDILNELLQSENPATVRKAKEILETLN